MPFIQSKVSVKMNQDQKEEIKTRLGQAITLLGKSEPWLMIGFEEEACLYFQGNQSERIAFVEVKLYGAASNQAYDSFTKEITEIYQDVLNIPPEKFYVKYEQVGHWGWNGTNF